MPLKISDDSKARMTRRDFLQVGAASVIGTLAWPGLLRAADSGGAAATRKPLSPLLAKAAAESPLVYVSPLKSNGEESACHGEVWFVESGGDLFVVTPPDRWRATSISQGLDSARLWVGDYGVWTRSAGRYRAAPTLDAKASLESDQATQARVLTAFGEKYTNEWGKWGPRFRDGLASGNRILIRYTPL